MEIEETEANPAPEETVAPVEQEAEASEAGAETEGESLESELEQYLDDGTGDDNPEHIEVEYEGKTYKLPPELKDALLRQGDYTKKTMTLAEERKAVEAAKAEAEELRSISGEKLKAVVTAQQAYARVEQLLATPVDGLSQEQVNALRLDLADAQAAAQHYAAQAEEAGTKEQQALSQQFAKAREVAVAEAAKHIPNFTETRRAELDSFVQSMGGKAGAVSELADPIAWQLVHFAEIGKKVLDRQRQAKAAQAVTSVQPAAEVKGKSAPVKKDLNLDADKMTTDEWVKQRNAELAKRR